MLFTLFLACTPDNGLQTRDDFEGPNDWSTIIVTPDRLSFGEMSYEAYHEMVFTIANGGTDHSILEIDDITFAMGEDDGYVIVDAPEHAELRITDPPIEVTVGFTSLDPGEQLGQLTIASDDEMSPATPVFMEAMGIMPRLVVSPDPYDYGEATIGCERETVFTLKNIGNDVLDVASVANEAAGFSILERPVLPLVLQPNEEALMSVGFVPIDDVAYASDLVVESSDPRGTRRVAQTGSGVFPGNYIDTYDVPAAGATDLLVIVDKSFSMTDEHAMLAANATAFAAGLASGTEDWQMMVVSADDGCSSSGVLTPETPEYVARFSDAVLNGTEGWHSEWGFHLADLALQQTSAFQCNAGFLRDNALLHVIFLTDEEDQSPESETTYVAQFQALKGAEHLFKVSLVGGDLPSGCTSGTNHAGPAKKYYEAAMATHGGFASICSADWHTQISTFASFGITRDTFSLGHTPDVRTLETLVDGLRRTSGWHYMSDSNSVIFDELPPESGNRVDLSYFVPYTCD